MTFELDKILKMRKKEIENLPFLEVVRIFDRLHSVILISCYDYYASSEPVGVLDDCSFDKIVKFYDKLRKYRAGYEISRGSFLFPDESRELSNTTMDVNYKHPYALELYKVYMSQI